MTPAYPASGAGLGHHAIPRPLPHMEMGIALGRHWRASPTKRVAICIAVMSTPLTPRCGRCTIGWRPGSVPIQHWLPLSPYGAPCLLPTCSYHSAPGAAARTSCCWLLCLWPWSSSVLSSPPGFSTVQGQHQTPPGPRPLPSVATARARSVAAER